MLRYFKIWLSLGWIMVLMVTYLSLIPSPPELYIEFEFIDKVEHFFAYFILMMWFAQIYQTDKGRIFYLLLFVLMGITLEILQGVGGVRFFEYGDMLANSLGALFAWFITQGRLKNIFVLFEQKITF